MKGNKYRITSFRDEIFIDEENIEEAIYRLNTKYEMMKALYEDSEEEIERLKQGYCELKEKCNKGECDCTHEEYNNMCEENIKMDLEIERLNNDIKELLKENENKEKVIKAQDSIIKEVREYITYWHYRNDFRTNSFTTGVKEELLKILDKEKYEDQAIRDYKLLWSK